ncbi:hypothetical protein IV203_015745 [Nitzschia inconspicua]|uniref:Transmembrane protein n=1 Tax=Nitzschia inconspicua TaxID=303405 RepID=A0A9K3PTR6_9STRA|nr:hypothetical protein IV203_015745 [Nitzschia inconspicua]
MSDRNCCKPGSCCCCENGGIERSPYGGDVKRRSICCDCCCKSCLPYDDAYMITAQFLSILAFLVSWIWYVTFILGAAAMIILQVAWCCRVGRAGLIWTVVISGLASVGCFVAGTLMILTWDGDTWCDVFTMQSSFDGSWYEYYQSDSCNEGAWAAVAFVAGVLWAATGTYVMIFLVSGRHARSLDVRSEQHEHDVDVGVIPLPIPPHVPPPGQSNRRLSPSTAEETDIVLNDGYQELMAKV